MLSRMNEKGHTPRHVAMKFENLWTSKNTIKDLDASCLQTSFKQFHNARGSWNNTFKTPRENYFHYRMHALPNYPSKWGQNKSILKKCRDSIFISYVHRLKNFLEDVLQLNGGKKNSRKRKLIYLLGKLINSVLNILRKWHGVPGISALSKLEYF